MVQPSELAARFDQYAEWRRRLAQSITSLHAWIRRSDLSDAGIDGTIERMLGALQEDQLVVAFVGEFPRAKSELINALFFCEFGLHLLPAAGRTTMCPTELLYDGTRTPSIRLLPIETRLKDTTVEDLRDSPDEWTTFPLNLSDAKKMSESIGRIAEVKRVSRPLARALGLQDDVALASKAAPPDDSEVEVPCWRHAIVNFPHPLLRHGLVVIDGPGHVSIGAEVELTQNLLPRAHMVLFVLAADSGVSATDLALWSRDLSHDVALLKAKRIVALNMIEALSDELTSEAAVTDEIDRQVAVAASLLGLPRSQICPVSAPKGHAARLSGDDALLRRSRLPQLEEALARKLFSSKRHAIGSAVQTQIRAVVKDLAALLDERQTRIAAELLELRELRGRNEDVVLHMMQRVREEKETFEQGLQRFTALRTVFTQHTNGLFEVLGLEALRANAGRTRESIERSTFTRGVRKAMAEFFRVIRRDLEDAERRSTEIHDMMQAMYTCFAREQGIEPFDAPPFAMLKYQKEIDRIEHAYNQHFNTLWNMLSNAKFSLTQRFFETVTSRVKHVYDVANHDIEIWLRAVMSPLETRMGERHTQLRRRLESVKRIHFSSGEIDERVAEFERQHEALAAQLTTLRQLGSAIEAVASQPDASPVAVNVPSGKGVSAR